MKMAFYLASVHSLVCVVGPGLPLGSVVWEADLSSAPSPATDLLDVTAYLVSKTELIIPRRLLVRTVIGVRVLGEFT